MGIDPDLWKEWASVANGFMKSPREGVRESFMRARTATGGLASGAIDQVGNKLVIV